ncbi:hypothetical protein NQ317_017533 [Molorchus minor]|uniref:Uncharacterized protein n=1 Tax=Molorchus minor TaxID=1323400 RepID=A0ABQ9JUL0_9CUCU|nr:hypothetical protein NQ317_017533 [Molorchus minor]
MLEFYPNLNLNPAMLPERSHLPGPDCNGRTGSYLDFFYVEISAPRAFERPVSIGTSINCNKTNKYAISRIQSELTAFFSATWSLCSFHTKCYNRQKFFPKILFASSEPATPRERRVQARLELAELVEILARLLVMRKSDTQLAFVALGIEMKDPIPMINSKKCVVTIDAKRITFDTSTVSGLLNLKLSLNDGPAYLAGDMGTWFQISPLGASAKHPNQMWVEEFSNGSADVASK